MLDFSSVTVLSFDCYGTLIDWEQGILSALRPLVSRRRSQIPDGDLLELYGRFEREAQAETPFVNYRTVLRRVVHDLGDHLDLGVGQDEENLLVESLADWQPFPDTVAALKTLKTRFALAIISNVDDDLFRLSKAYLEVPFDWVITSEQLGSYKPSERNFKRALEAFGVASGRHVHVAQSLYHDIAPAGALGLRTVWVNRGGAASTPGAGCEPDLEVADLQTLASLTSLPAREGR
jgi:2-haloacid dehalogenase